MLDFLGLSFLNLPFLLGALTAAIPLVLHLSRSRRTKKIRFSTTRFFTDQFLRSYRMSRLKELLLLACRMALCFFLAAAFAQPLLMPKGQSFLVGKARSVVLVVDDSASMGFAEDGRTLLDRARDSARELFAGLGSGDTVSVVLAGRRAGGPRVLCEHKPHAELGDVLQELNQLAVATAGTDLAAAVARAEDLAQASAAPSKEVYVLSDLQDSGWDVQNEELAARQGSDVLFFFVQVRPREPANTAVTAVQYGAARPMAGMPFSIRPLLHGPGNQGAVVRLYVYDQDGKPEKVGERAAEQLQNGRWAAPRFHHTFRAGGWQAGYVEVADDRLPQDNRRYFALEVLDTVDVLAVGGGPSLVQDEFLFLKAAAPEGRSPVRVRVDGPAALSGDLGKYPLVILANVPRLPDEAVERLEDYVDRGGSLWVFLGDRVDPAFYNQALAAATRRHGGLLPGQLGRKREESGRDQFAGIASVAYRHPALTAFQDAKNGNLGRVTFKALQEVRPHDDAAVLMYARELPREGGDAAAGQGGEERWPLLLEKEFGKGRVLLFASTCNTAWNNLPTRPVFLPWTYRLIGYLAQRPLSRQGFYATGEAVPIPVAQTEGLPPLVVRKPDGTTGYAVQGNDPDNPLEFTDTAQAGVYALSPERQEARQLFAVNLDPYESDLTYLDEVLAAEGDGPAEARVEAGLQRLLPNRPLVSYVADPARVTEASLAARRGVKLWDVLLWGLLVLLLVEPWLANRISLRHYARPPDLSAAPAPRQPAPPPAAPAVQEVSSR